ncbi:hypothetical protein LguiB_006254 [Lonicera macranthoides]
MKRNYETTLSTYLIGKVELRIISFLSKIRDFAGLQVVSKTNENSFSTGRLR